MDMKVKLERNYIQKFDEGGTSAYLFGCLITPELRQLIALPVRYGGLGIPILADLAVKEYSTSILVDNMHPDGSTDTSTSQDELKRILNERVAEYEDRHEKIVAKLDTVGARLVEQNMERGSSNWLSCLPLKRFDFSFNKAEFRDLIRLQ